MPTYDYRCLNCGWETEVTQKITEEPIEFLRHPIKGKSNIKTGSADPRKATCSGQMKRLIGATSFVLKGGGWSSGGYA